MPVWIVDALREVAPEVAVADRLAGGEPAIAEEQEGLAALQPVDLARERFEIGGRPHDRIGHAGFDQRRLEGELRVLESEERLLHADRRQQHHLRNPGVAARRQRLHMGLVIDRPGVLRRACPRGEAGDERVEPLAGERSVAAQRNRVGDVAKPGDGSLGQLRRTPVPARPHEADDLVPAFRERPRRRLADRAGGAEQHDPPPGWRRIAAHAAAPVIPPLKRRGGRCASALRPRGPLSRSAVHG